MAPAVGFHLVFPTSLRGWLTTPVHSFFPFVCWLVGSLAERSTNQHTDELTNLCSGPEGIRTPDLYSAIVALSQLSYRPKMTLLILTQPAKFVKPSILKTAQYELSCCELQPTHIVLH